MAREPHRTSEILDAVALLVVDMQDAFLNVMPDRDAVLRRTALAIESARAFGLKVIFTEQVPAKLGHTHADLLALAPEARVFAKNEFSALLAEGLQEYLRRINVYHLLLAGIETPICIYQTALHAQDQELDVTILSDCTTGRRPDDCLVVIEALSRADCHVLPAETVFYSMLGSSLNPRFAHFTRIVKRYAGEDPIGGGPTPAPEPPPESRESRRDSHDRERGGRDRPRDRHEQGGRRHRDQAHPETGDEAPDISAEDIEELRAEDGISEAEANQPSYEEVTGEGDDSDRDHEGTPQDDSSEPETDDTSTPHEDHDDTQAADGEGTAKKKRPRRRRGGARRRRARERASGQSAEGADQPAADSTPSDAPAGDAPAGSTD